MKFILNHSDSLRRYTSILCFSLLFGVAGLLTGCKAEPLWNRPNPEIVLRGFLQSAEAQRTDLVWNYLGEKTRDALSREAENFNKLIDKNDHPRKPEEMMRFGHVISSTREYKKLEVISADQSRAVVRIVRLNDMPHIDVVLTRENDRWTVELPLRQEKDV